MRFPPGKEIYRKLSLSVFEVDGRDSREYSSKVVTLHCLIFETATAVESRGRPRSCPVFSLPGPLPHKKVLYIHLNFPNYLFLLIYTCIS